ncbi:MAG: NusG domain II-containing protein [Clostridia bacterium]|nr:NusG domain II-containing protein [Clostridia bacterium]
MKKRDFIVIGIVLAAAALAALALAGADGGVVNVYLDGELYRSLPYGEPAVLRIEQDTGEVNVIRITEQGVAMESSTCANQVCVHRGCVSGVSHIAGDNWIICLPNRVSVEVLPHDL